MCFLIPSTYVQLRLRLDDGRRTPKVPNTTILINQQLECRHMQEASCTRPPNQWYH